MTYENQVVEVVTGEIKVTTWVKIGEHDRKVLNELYQGFEKCTHWLVALHEDAVTITPFAEDTSTPCREPFSKFDGVELFPETVEQLLEDSYYEDFE